MRSKWLISVSLVVCLVMAFALPMCAPAPAPPVEEEKPPVEEELAKSIKAYISATPENNAEIAAFVKEKLGVEVRHTFMSCGEVEAKMIAEAPRFAADMDMVACGPQAFLVKEKRWSIPYASPAWEGTTGIFKDPDNYWFGIGVSSFVLVYNKEMLAEKGLTPPESWDDLLDPKWKGQIVMPSPLTSGTAFRMLFTFMTIYGFNRGKGEEGGWEYLEALDENVAHYTRGGAAPEDLVGRGEFVLGISLGSNVPVRMKAGYPIDWTVPKEGTGYDLNAAFIFKGTKEEYTCRKIIDLQGGKEFSELYGTFGFVPKHPEVHSVLFGATPNFVPNLDLPWAYENKSRLCDEWKDRIGRVAR